MPAKDDRWDVVVVGLRDPSHANLVMVSAELAHYASLPGEDVERLLSNDDEVEVLANLDRSEAERAAQELNMLGAVVDLRLAVDDDGVFPVFKPDADRQVGVAVGGLIDDSATPPTVGEVRGMLPDVEPDPEAGRMRAHTPAPRRAPAAARPARRGPTDPLDRLPMGDSGMLGLGELGGPPGIGEALPAPPPRDQPARARLESVETPRGGAASSSASRARPAVEVEAKPRAKPKAKAKPKAPALGDIGGGPPPGTEAPTLPDRLQRAAPSTDDAPMGLELDFEAVGLSKPPPKGGIPKAAPPPSGSPAPGTSASNMPRRTRAGNMGGSGHSAAGRSNDAPSGLFDALRRDVVAGTLMSLGAALVLSLIVAIQIQRSSARDVLPPLEEELAAALSDPAGVQTGERRPPEAIEFQIGNAVGDMERTFFLWWLGLGIPVGLVVSRLLAR